MVQKALELHLGPEVLATDLKKLLTESVAFFEGDLGCRFGGSVRTRRLEDAVADDVVPTQVDARLELGVAEVTLGAGVAAGAAGTLGLAAGWHTLAYSATAVAPPAAAAAIVATWLVAWAAKNREMRKRIDVARKAAEHYHRSVVAALFASSQSDQDSKTLHEVLEVEIRSMVDELVNHAARAERGELTEAHVRTLVLAADQHLVLASDCMDMLGQPDRSESAAGTAGLWQRLTGRWRT